MKKSGLEKIQARATDELLLILFFLLLAMLVQTAFNFYQSYQNIQASDQFAEMILYEESYLLPLNKINSARMISRFCPDSRIQALDLVKVYEEKCELSRKGASNWTRLASGKKMLINLALTSELEIIPGIGKKRAREIINFRERLNGFQQLDDLMQIQWMKEEMLKELKTFFTTED